MVWLCRLASRFGAGQRVELWRVLQAAGLTQHERHVVRQRLQGRSHGAIGRELGCSRQAVHIGERRGLAKLGLPESYTLATVHAQQQAEGAERLQERAGLTVEADLRHDEGPALRCKLDESARAERELDALTEQYIREAEAGITPRRATQYRRQAEALASRIR